MIVKANESNVLVLGRPGENETTTIVFDVKPYRNEFGIGDAQLMVTRPGESEPYPVALTKTTDTVAWTTQLADVFKPGKGRAQLTYYVSGKAVKSTIYTTMVLDSLQSVPEPPEPMQGWVEQITQVGAQATVDANKAKSYAVGGTGTREGEDTDNAKYYSEQAGDYAFTTAQDLANVEQLKKDTEALKQGVDASEQHVVGMESNVSRAEQNVTDMKQAVEFCTGKASQYSSNAKVSATNAKTSEDNAKTSEENSRKYSENAKQSESNAKTSEDNAKASELAVNEKADGFTDAVVKATETAVKSVTAEGEKQREILTDISKPLASNDDLMKLAIKPEVQGNPVVLNDSAEFPVAGLELGGSTSQVQTSGKQLLIDFVKDKIYKNGSTIKINDDKSVNIHKMKGISIDVRSPLLLKKGTYTLSVNTPSRDCYFQLNYSKGSITVRTENSNTFTLENDETVTLILYSPTDSAIDITLKIMLNEGVSALPYEPYTGGEPSPSPEYPQKIVNGEWDKVSNTGKNLIIKKLKGYAGILSNPQVWFEDEQCVSGLIDAKMLSGKTLTASSKNGNRINLAYVDTDTPVQGTPIVKIESHSSGMLKHTFKVDVNPTHKFIAIQFSYKAEADEIQVELSSTPTTYEPYKGFTETLPEKITLSKWDKIKLIDGVWKKENYTYRLLLKTLNKVAIGTHDNGQRYVSISTNVLDLIANEKENPYSNIYISSGWTNTDLKVYCPSRSAIVITDNRFTDLDTFKKIVNEENTVVYYKTVTPSYETLPPETQDLLNKIATFYPNTVLQTNEGITLDLQYVADTKNYIDNKHNKDIAELQAMLLER